MMKKVLALILALVMVFAMGSVAFAANAGPNTQDVLINVQKETVHSFTISWGTYEYTYKYGTWNEEDGAYESEGWVDEAGKPIVGNPSTTISVTNASNVAITVDAAYAANQSANDALDTVDAQFVGGNSFLPSAVGALAEDLTVEYTLTITGAPKDVADTYDPELVLGTITITITPAD